MLRAICILALSLPPGAQAQTQHDLLLGREVGFVGVGLALHGSAAMVDRANRQTLPPTPDLARVPRLDRVAVGQWSLPVHRASNWLFMGASAGCIAGGLWLQHGERPLEPLAITAQSLLITSGLTNTVKQLVRRPRPYMYDPDVPVSLHDPRRDRVSFWSGHTANVAAMTVSTACMVQRSDASTDVKTATWAGACITPAVMGFLRVKAGRHFPTDVLAGCAVGALVGFAVPYFHRVDGPTQ